MFNRRTLMTVLGLGLTAAAAVSAQPAKTATTPASASTPIKLRVFGGGRNQRPDLMRVLFDRYQKAHPHVAIDVDEEMPPRESHRPRRQRPVTIHARKAVATQRGEADAATGVHAAMPARGYSAGAHVGKHECVTASDHALPSETCNE